MRPSVNVMTKVSNILAAKNSQPTTSPHNTSLPNQIQTAQYFSNHQTKATLRDAIFQTIQSKKTFRGPNRRLEMPPGTSLSIYLPISSPYLPWPTNSSLTAANTFSPSARRKPLSLQIDVSVAI